MHSAAAAAPVSLKRRRFESLSRRELLELYRANDALYHEWLRRMIVQHHRIDLLAEEVLGYRVCSHHRRMLVHQYGNRESLVLVFRGSGKTTMLTITWGIWALLCDPNLRILIASKTGDNAEGMLKEIKTHFESNERLRAVFGDMVGTTKWDTGAIEVRGRTIPYKEPSIDTVGVEGALASRHFDMILADDLVDDENTRTKARRDGLRQWNYKLLKPCLLQPNGSFFRGRLHYNGTRYHPDDLHGSQVKRSPDGIGGDLADKRLVIPAISEDGESTWPEEFSLDRLLQMRDEAGLLIFNSQMQCDCDAMRGEIFRYDDCRIVDDGELPSNLRVFIGVDLAISESERADMFALVVIGVDAVGAFWVLDHFEGHLRFPEQTALIIEKARQHRAIRVGIETNAYQRAQLHQVKKEAPDLNVVGLNTDKDKVTNAWRVLARHFEAGRFHFRRSCGRLVEQLVLFPNYRYKDSFDATVLAVRASEARVRKEDRRGRVGLL